LEGTASIMVAMAAARPAVLLTAARVSVQALEGSEGRIDGVEKASGTYGRDSAVLVKTSATGRATRSQDSWALVNRTSATGNRINDRNLLA
tara:strand:- start:1878 stop:2150 length:273 start_codon:yes stop_codon:yes gene_type:complete